MIPSGATRRKVPDREIWAVAAILSSVALGLVLVAPSAPQAASSSGSLARSPPDLQGGPPPERGGAQEDGIEGFHARMSAFRRVEAALARAFTAAGAGATRPPSPRPARVARGADAQACLAQAVYYEARGEPVEGQAAVAQVVLNRARSGRHPADVCGVVFEGAARPGCQFSFACDPRLAGRRPEPLAWGRARTVAADALGGADVRPDLADALNYHADYVRPRWAAQLTRAAVIGRHVFYAAGGAVDAAAARWSFPTPPPPAASGV